MFFWTDNILHGIDTPVTAMHFLEIGAYSAVEMSHFDADMGSWLTL